MLFSKSIMSRRSFLLIRNISEHSISATRNVLLRAVLLSIITLSIPFAFAETDSQARADFDYTKTKPQNIFHTPVYAPFSEHSWGEPAIAWNNGEYFLIYDTLVDGAPANLMTSKDGVFWKEEGPVLYPDAAQGTFVECPDIRRFTSDGPFVMSYDANLPDKDGKDQKVRRFAVSYDLRHWEKVAGVTFGPDESFYKRKPFYNQYSFPNPKGGWYALLNVAPKNFVGLGLAESHDGVHWEHLPPVQVKGVPDWRPGFQGPGGKALETSGILQIDGRYFVLGINSMTMSDNILTSRKIEGPYQPTPKNSILTVGPQVFHRVYDLPGGYLSMPTIWADGEGLASDRGRGYYHVAPFRSVESDGESLWFKWWVGNEKLKTHPLSVSLDPDSQKNSSLRMLSAPLDFSKGLVFEAGIVLAKASKPAHNWAHFAKVTADNALAKPSWPANYFTPDRAVDEQFTTGWRGYIPEDGSPITFDVDLNKIRPIGSIQIHWMETPVGLVVKHSLNGAEWSALPQEKYADLDPPQSGNTLFFEPTVLEKLGISARFLRFELTVSPPVSDMLGGQVAVSEIVVSPEPFEKVATNIGGLFIETKPGEGWAWFVSQKGRIRFGKVSDGGTRFSLLKERELGLNFGATAELRIVMRDDLVDLYVDDYQVDYYQLVGSNPSGRIGLYSSADIESGHAPKAWIPDPSGAN